VTVVRLGGLARPMLLDAAMERKVNTKRVEHHVPEPDEKRSYNLDNTPTEDEHPPMKSPPQETGTMKPHT
jgi:hypothetical protein